MIVKIAQITFITTHSILHMYIDILFVFSSDCHGVGYLFGVTETAAIVTKTFFEQCDRGVDTFSLAIDQFQNAINPELQCRCILIDIPIYIILTIVLNADV